MAHSNQVREFILTKNGIDLVDVYIGPSGILAGSRLSQEAAEKAERILRDQASDKRRRDLEKKA